MSSILKALQKLEQERAARRGGPPDISGEILKRGKTGKSTPRWLLPATMAIVAAAAVLATYTFMGGFSTRKDHVSSTTTSSAPPPATAPAPFPADPAQAAAIRGTATPSVLPPTAVVRDVPVARRTVTQETSLVPKPAPRPTTPVTVSTQQISAAPTKTDTPPPAPAEPSRPSLNVGGIAWQQSSSLRLAVVNGMSVSEGSVVEGARVEEIFPDRIRFSFRSQHFELPLVK